MVEFTGEHCSSTRKVGGAAADPVPTLVTIYEADVEDRGVLSARQMLPMKIAF